MCLEQAITAIFTIWFRDDETCKTDAVNNDWEMHGPSYPLQCNGTMKLRSYVSYSALHHNLTGGETYGLPVTFYCPLPDIEIDPA